MSTTVRAGLKTAGLRALFGTVGRIAPAAAGELAQRLFFSPPRRFAGQVALPPGGQPFHVESEGRRIAAWRWGSSGPVVVLMHGWGGSSAQLSRLVSPLLDRGYSVVALDAPAHGRTPGRTASLPEFARALAAVVRAVGPVHALVGHSLGAAAAALAVAAEGVGAQRLALIGSAADPGRWARMFAARFRVPHAAMARMGERSERRLGFRWANLHLGGLLRGYAGAVLFVHDRDDREVRWSEAWQLAQEHGSARAVFTSGLGHRRILLHPGVARLVADFVAGQDVDQAAGVPLAPLCQTAGCARPVDDAHVLCGRCTLDRHLFQRDGARWPVDVA
jgi:pimeloyl-ACP methyl ester carboxylesterase